MKLLPPEPPVTICVLTSGDHAALARRAIGSISRHIERSLYRMVVGANAVGIRTRRYLEKLQDRGEIDQLIFSQVNLGKCPMMRRMFEHLRSEFIWWFDDDSYVTSSEALGERLRIARASPPTVVASPAGGWG